MNELRWSELFVDPRVGALATLGLLRLLALVTVALVSARFLLHTTLSGYQRYRGLISDKASRKLNPSISAGVFLQLSGSSGLVLLIIRQLMLKASGHGWWYFLLFRDPDLIGVVAYAACSALIAMGGALLVRGVRALVIDEAAGQLPAWMRPRRRAAREEG